MEPQPNEKRKSRLTVGKVILLELALVTCGVWIHRAVVEAPARRGLASALEEGGWGVGLTISGKRLDEIYQQDADHRFWEEWGTVQLYGLGVVACGGLAVMLKDAAGGSKRRAKREASKPPESATQDSTSAK